ncbi:sensor histidine kinase, partial [Clavibacter lycopersici]
MTSPVLASRSETDARRRRGSTRAQLPFLLSCAVVAVIVALIEPAVQRDPWYVAAMAVVVVGSVLAAVIARSRIPSAVLIVVPALDLLAVAAIRHATAASLPAAALLVIFPLLWLVFGFPSGGVPVAVAGALVITLFPLMREGGLPRTADGWADLVGGLLLTALLVGAAAQAAAMLR